MENSLLSVVQGVLISGGVLAALISVIFAHRLTVSLFRGRSRALEKAFYNELSIIKEDFLSWFPTLMEEYRTPLKQSYSGPAPLNVKLIENLVLELAGTDKIISSDQRIFVSRMERSIKSIKQKNQARDIYIKRWIENEDSLDSAEICDIYSNISFITAQLLVDTSQAIYFLNKVLSERNRFNFTNDSHFLTFFEFACSDTNIEFNREECRAIINRIGFKQ